LKEINNTSKKTRENIKEYLRRETALGLKVLRRRGVRSPRNQRDLVEETRNRLDSPLPLQEMEWKLK
jgi:hypothetical protein